MELSYWQSRWRKGNTGFHMDEGYPGLEKYWAQLGISNQATALVPLCGKSKDLIWLAGNVNKVVGVEISELAIRSFLDENKLTATESKFANFSIFRSGNIELWCGDFFKLPSGKIKNIDLIYDKSALVALPLDMRKKYADKLIYLSAIQTKMLIHHFEYRQEEMNGPPFSVPPDEFSEHFSEKFTIDRLEKTYLDLKMYQKFQKRGLKSYLIEYLSLLSRKESN